MKLIVGLGNPGERYVGTRHNVGFEVIDALAKRWRLDVGRDRFHGRFGKGQFRHEPVLLFKPTTYMNRSGRAVLAAGKFYKLEADDLLVVTDDVALPVGRLRMRVRGSSGGHNGLQDIIDRLGTDQWCRLRVGVGDAVHDQVSHVLGKFEKEDEQLMDRTRERAADAVECWLVEGPDLTMTRFNGDVPGDDSEQAST